MAADVDKATTELNEFERAHAVDREFGRSESNIEDPLRHRSDAALFLLNH